MIEISTKKEFISWLSKQDIEFEDKYFDRSYYRPPKDMLYLKDFELKEIKIDDRHFECTEFRSCKFEKCDFNNSFIVSCTLIDCQFLGCRFTWSKFLDMDLFNCQFNNCVITGLELSDVVFKLTEFNSCPEILDLSIRGNRDREIAFNNCDLHFMDIEPTGKDNIDIISFYDCIIAESSFDRVNFKKSYFKDNSFSINQFSACAFSDTTFIGNNVSSGNEFSNIDFRTILNSSKLDNSILENVFGIPNSDIKEYLIGLTYKIEFQSIFISYSFKDKEFAKLINDELTKRGVSTFLWEKDSPGGKTLTDIMSTEVRFKDRILFISSRNSLKSDACHFELSEGRKKQTETWEDVLFPIHIDNFLFEVKREQIRPMKKQKEYWQNIKELRKLNSLSFQEFVIQGKCDSFELEQIIFRLIKGLRK